MASLVFLFLINISGAVYAAPSLITIGESAIQKQIGSTVTMSENWTLSADPDDYSGSNAFLLDMFSKYFVQLFGASYDKYLVFAEFTSSADSWRNMNFVLVLNDNDNSNESTLDIINSTNSVRYTDTDEVLTSVEGVLAFRYINNNTQAEVSINATSRVILGEIDIYFDGAVTTPNVLIFHNMNFTRINIYPSSNSTPLPAGSSQERVNRFDVLPSWDYWRYYYIGKAMMKDAEVIIAEPENADELTASADRLAEVNKQQKQAENAAFEQEKQASSAGVSSGQESINNIFGNSSIQGGLTFMSNTLNSIHLPEWLIALITFSSFIGVLIWILSLKKGSGGQ